jgi:hypothetical protein
MICEVVIHNKYSRVMLSSPLKQLLLILLCIWIVPKAARAAEVLIVADEIPAMEALAKALKEENIESEIVTQAELPASLAGYRAVVVYIHQDLYPGPEQAFIDYTKNGGKLICLHHTVSSKKRQNAEWFSFLGIDLPPKEAKQGGYQYVGDITMEIVNLAPRHYITTHQVAYDRTITYTNEKGKKRNLPGFALQNTEGFLNHDLQGPRTVLLGYKFTDKSGRLWMQDRAAWCMPVGKGWVFYSQPGHAVSDFENPIYTRIIINAVLYQPN